MNKNPKSFLSKALAVALTVLMLVAASVLVVGAAETVNVAKIGDTKYATLAEAISKATAGQTIELIADVNENVTISKNLTIDGASFNYTGEIAFKNQTVTIKNVNFVNGNINQNGSGNAGALDVLNCTFTGKNANSKYGSYAIHVYGYGKVTVTNCAANSVNLLYVRGSTPSVSVTDSTIDNLNGWGAHIVPDCTAVFNRVTFENLECGVVAQNPGVNTKISFNNCQFVNNVYPVVVWNKTNKTIAFNFEGTNEMNTTDWIARIDNNNYPFISGFEKAVVTAEAQNGTKIGSLKAIAAVAQPGDTIKLLADYTGEEFTLPEGVKLDANGKNGADNITVVEVIEIRTWEDLKALDARVEGGDMLEGVIVKLMNDIDLYEMGADGEPVTFNPIGHHNSPFSGTFDGQGYTIKNMYQSGWALGYEWGRYGSIGLFGGLKNATIKNLTIENAECFVEGGDVGALTGSAEGDCTFDNIKVVNCVFATYNNGCGGLVGWAGAGNYNFKNIIVDGDTVIAGLWGSFDSSLGGVLGQLDDGASASFENVKVACRLDAYNDVTAAYKYYAYRMCGMLIGRIPVDANNQPILDNVTIGENVVIDYSNTPDYTYAIIDGSWKRLEAGYAYGGVDLTQYPEAEVIYKPFNSMFGGQQYGSYGQDDHEDIEALGRVAMFDGEYYTSLENAIKAADGAKDKDGNLIPVKLLADYDKDIVISDSLVLDLNGYNLTGNVTTSVAGYKVVCENGTYKVVSAGVAKIGDEYYATLAEALAEANKAAGNYTITLLADCAEEITFAQNADVNITIDGNGNTFNGQIILSGAGSLTFSDMTITPTILHNPGTDSEKLATIILNAATAPNITIDDCTMKNTGTKGAIVWGQASYTTTKVVIKNSTASNLQYLVGTNQAGAAEIEIENVTATNMAYLVRSMKATKVTVKDVTYSGLTFIQIRVTSLAHTLILEDVDVKTNGYAPIMVVAPETGDNAPVAYSIQLKGTNTFVRDGEAITVEEWFDNPSSAERPYNIYLTSLGMTLAGPEGLTNIKTNVEGCNVEYKDGAYKVVNYVAQIGNNKYSSLADAIAAANAGDTIVFLKDITENVTINKAITIDGNGKNYTGKMAINTSLIVTIKNVNFVKGYIEEASGPHGTLTIDNCTFDGVDNLYDYAIKVQGGDKLTVTNSSAIGGYSLGMLYVPSAVTEITVAKVTAKNMTVAFNITYSGDALFEEVSFENIGYGIHFQIHPTGSRTYTVKNSDLSGATNPFWFWDKSNGADKVTVVFEGDNIVPKFQSSIAGYLKLAAGATLKAPADVVVDTDVIGYDVTYANGRYELVQLLVEVTTTNIRMGETISHLFAVPYHKNIREGFVARININGEKDENNNLIYTTIPYSAIVDGNKVINWKSYEVGNEKYLVIEFTGIAAKQMTDVVTIEIYFGNEEVPQSTCTTSVRDYAMAFINSNDTDAVVKTMLVDMLNYGAAAQNYFGYKKDDLANNKLKKEQQVLATYAACNHDHSRGDVLDPHFMGTSVRFENAITLVLKVYIPEVNGDISKISATFDITGEVVEIREDEDKANNPHVYYIELRSLVVAEAHKNVTCKIFVKDADNNTATKIAEIQDSVAGYVARRLSVIDATSDAAKLYTAFIKFANSAIAYKSK